MSRSLLKNTRVYVDGYDMSGYARNFGPLGWAFEEATDDPINASVKRTWAGQANIGVGTVNALLDNTATSGIHTVLGSGGTNRTVLIVFGMLAAPVANVPCFGGQFQQNDYIAAPSENPVSLSIAFANTAALCNNSLYSQPWGVLLRPLTATTAANSSTGHDGAASSAKGGFMVYQVTAGNGTATIKVQDADTNVDGSFSDLLSSGVIDCSSPTAGVVALSPTATVERYTRWQIALGTATSVTLALGFFRNTI